MSQMNNHIDGMGGSGHMVVQTQSVSIASSDGSVIHQTNTYESWVTMSGPQPMNLDMVPSAGQAQNLFQSLDVGRSPIMASRAADTYLAVPMTTDILSSAASPVTVNMQTPYVSHNHVEPVVALPAQMAVAETPMVAAVQNPAETFIAVPVPATCDPIVAVPTVQNLYNPILGATESSVPILQTSSVPHTPQANVPSWYLVVQDIPEAVPGVNGISGSPSVVRTDDDLFLCMRCNSTFEKASCVNWHLRECKGNNVKTNTLPTTNVISSTTTNVKMVQCTRCARLFNVFHEQSSHFICSDCSTSTVPFTINFGAQPLKQFKCSECSECFHLECDLDEHLTSHRSTVTICELPDNYTEENGNDDDNGSVIIEPMVESPEDNDESISCGSDNSNDVEPEQSSSETCGECGSTFSCHDSLNEHFKTHDDIRSYGCTKCGIICVGRHSLNRHVWAHSRESEEKEVSHSCFEEENDETKDVIVTQPFGCTECGMQFSDSNDLKEHCMSHLRFKPFLCTQCGEKFETTSTLERHWEAHALAVE